MPWTDNQTIQSLRLRYNLVLAAHRECHRALLNARAQGCSPSPELVEADAKARVELEDVRAKLLAAMTLVITGGTELEPPSL